MFAVLGCLALVCAGGDELSGAKQSPVAVVAKKKAVTAPEPEEIWPLTLDDAIDIGLNNSESVRVLWTPACEQIVSSQCFGPAAKNTITIRPTKGTSKEVIGRVDAETPMWRFQTEVMELVRTTERQYWNLAHRHALLWSWSKAIELTEAVLKAEKNKLTPGRGTIADPAEAEARLEQFQSELTAAKSDLVVAERQFRKTLGLPPADSRHIVPVTPPRKHRAELCWDECVALMSAHQPDVVRQGAEVRQVEWLSKNVARALSGSELVPSLDPELVVSVEEQLKLEATRQRELLGRVEEQAGRSLTRSFQDVDTSDKLWQAASRLRVASGKRLEAQRAFYEEDRIPVDRYLDAVSTDCAAKAREEQAKAAYSLSLTMLEEAKGTLLTTLGIEVRDAPHRRQDSGWDNAVKSASLELELVPVLRVSEKAKTEPPASNRP